MTLKYLFAKLLVYIQIPAIKSSKLHKTSKIGQKSSVNGISIGKYSYIGRNNNITNTDIGNFCSLGSFVTIGGGIHPLNRISTSPLFYDHGNEWKTSDYITKDNEEITQIRTMLGNDVWVGDNCYIKAGLKIGDGAIIGAGSVVTHDVPPYAIVAGVPAKIIRFRFNAEYIQSLLESEWWNMDENQLKRKRDCFSQQVDNNTILKLLDK